jgi:Skp family chaperone for outer membrane proteins
MKLPYKSFLAVTLLAGMTLMARAQVTAAPAATPARAGATTPPPSRMAVVNVVLLFEKLLEKSAADTDLANMKKKTSEEITAKQAELTSLQKKMETFKEDSDEYRQRQEELLGKAMELEVFTKVAEAKYVNETHLRTKDLYRKINAAIADYSKQQGIAMVFVADNIDLDKLRSPEQFQAIVTTRKILYYNDSYDITIALVTKMNTDFSLRTPAKP